MNSPQLLLIPHISEKAYGQSQGSTYVFKAALGANKQQIAAAVTAQYGVRVADVRTVVVKGKLKRAIRKGKSIEGRRSNLKKAYVTLVEGDSIKVFDEVTEEEKK